MPNLILITLIPGKGADPGQFSTYLTGLSITAYDNSVHATSKQTLLGTANTVANPGDGLTVTQQSSTTNASITPNIMQHYDTISIPPAPPIYPLQSVATAVIVANIDPTTNPQPYPEYPTPTSYDIQLTITRNGIDLSSDIIDWNATINTVNSVSPVQTDYFNMGYPLFDADLANLSTSTFLVLPPPPPTTEATGASSFTLNSKGQPPPFNDLANAINAVLAMDAPPGGGSLGVMGNTLSTTNVLTTAQCAAIAAEIVYNRAIVPLPTPDLPSGVSLEQLFTLPAPSNSNYDQTIQKFTGSLTAYYATNDSNAQRLAGYIYAVSAAVYAESQTSDAIFANLTFPIDSSLQTATSNSSASVLLSGLPSGGTGSSLNALNPSFVVPAAYFYALGYAYPVQLSPAQRYKAILTSTADNLTTNLQAAIDSGILGAPPTAPALVTAQTTLASNNNTQVNSAQALRRLTALGASAAMNATAVSNATSANSTSTISSKAPTSIPLTGSVADIVNLWLQVQDASDAAFWLNEATSSDYLNLILVCIAQGNTSLVSDILANIQVTLPSGGSPVAITQASYLTLIQDAQWQAFFAKFRGDLPDFTQPGSTTQRTQAFIGYLQKFFAVSFAPSTTQSPTAGSIPVLFTNTPSDLLWQFFSAYPSFTFATALNTSTLSTAVQNAFPNDARIQAWVTNAITILYALYNMTSSSSTGSLQFSYMEALYARGFTSAESVTALSLAQFTSALTGTVAFQAAWNIYTLAGGTNPTPPTGSGGFAPVNPGNLIDCIPPPHLSPLGLVEYLSELLALQSGTLVLGNLVSSRRGPLGNLLVTVDNLATQLPLIDLAIESLELLGSNLAASPLAGAVYNTNSANLFGPYLGNEPPGLDLGKYTPEDLYAAMPANSSPAVPVAQPAIYDVLKAAFSTPSLPYSQALDVCRSYLCALRTTRFSTMCHFRQQITELPQDATNEPPDFQSALWRYPVRLELALEFLCISPEEYAFIYSGNLKTEQVAQLYISTATNQTGRVLSNDVLLVGNFLAATGLSYCEFLQLWKSGFVTFSNSQRNANGVFPDCPPCCLNNLVIYLGDQSIVGPLSMLIVFIRLWRTLNKSCCCRDMKRCKCGDDDKDVKISMARLADICNVLGLFTATNVNPSFIRQLASLLILREKWRLPWTDEKATPGSNPTPVQTTELLALWSGQGSSTPEWKWAVKMLLCKVEEFAEREYRCDRPRKHAAEFRKILAENLDTLSHLAGFSDQYPWYLSPTCTIRFAEVLSKIWASEFTIGQLIFLFTAQDHLDGDDPFPISYAEEAKDDPLEEPEDDKYGLWELRKELLDVKVSEEEAECWDWWRIEAEIRKMGYGAQSSTATTPGNTDDLLSLAQHFFPEILEEAGHHVHREKRRYSTPLPVADTSPHMWSAPPCDPFHYDSEASSGNDGPSGSLWIELPLKDEAVLRKLRDTRQLNGAEINAVQNLYFAPRAALAPFACIFENFHHALNWLVQERCGKERFNFFRREFARFHKRCKVIAKHLARHVGLATCGDGKEEEEHHPKVDVAWRILESLVADENLTTDSWELDSGVAPTQYTWDPFFSGGAFAALLGLVGTGLLGEYTAKPGAQWREILDGLDVFGAVRNESNTPVPTIIPSLSLTPSTAQQDLVAFKNGFALSDKSGHELSGAQPFDASWKAALIVCKGGQYSFRMGGARPVDDEQQFDCMKEDQWLVTLRRGQKTYTVLKHKWEGEEAPSYKSHPLHLRHGAYEIVVRFKQVEPRFLTDDEVERIYTGLEVKYKGPDTEDCLRKLPFTHLIQVDKTGSLSSGLQVPGNAGKFLDLQYVSSLRDIRRTYQRAFKAVLFAHNFCLSADKDHCEWECELGFMLDHPDRFLGTSYYSQVPTAPATATFQTHHAYFNFNFLPVTDTYHPPTSTADMRVAPSAKRQAAMFDWWERTFDYVHLRSEVHEIRKKPLWLMFREVADQSPIHDATQLVRYLGVDIALALLVLTYFVTPPPLYQVSHTDLLDERWATRVWHAGRWLHRLHKTFYTTVDLLVDASPALWAADDPAASTGNQNLTTFFQQSCLAKPDAVFRLNDITVLNDGLRERSRCALLSYLCSGSLVPIDPIMSGQFATVPRDLSDLLLQDVEAGLKERSSRIEDAIHSVQTFVQRARIGLEPTSPLTGDFSKQWECQFSTFEIWQAHKRRQIYAENWIQWEDAQRLEKVEGYRSLKQQLRMDTSTITVPGRPFWWPQDLEFPSHPTIETLQSRDFLTLGLQNNSLPEGLSLIGTPSRDTTPTWLAPVTVSQTTNNSGGGGGGSSNNTSKVVPTAQSEKEASQSHAIVKADSIKTQMVSAADVAGISTLQSIPLWIQAAVRLGSRFIRIAASSLPIADPYGPHQDGATCCKQCGQPHPPVMDEYYFWLEDAHYYDVKDVNYPNGQDADIGVTQATSQSGQPTDIRTTQSDPQSSWEDPTMLPTLLQWPSEPLIHLFWTRVHLGVLENPHRSAEGIQLNSGDVPDLEFTGRDYDSLIFTVTTTGGFRYDLATDTAVVTPEVVAGTFPTGNLPPPLSAYPYFIYFEPGAPLIPISPFGTSLIVAGALRSDCQFEAALKWCQVVFDPLSSANTWAQCPPSTDNGGDTVNDSDTKDEAKAASESVSQVVSDGDSKDLFHARVASVSSSSTNSKAILTPTYKSAIESSQETQTPPQDLPCCPTSPVTGSIARHRAVLLEYLDILLQWGDQLLCRDSLESFQQALVIFNIMDRLLGPRPNKVDAQDLTGGTMTVGNFTPSPASLNPRLLRLYDDVVDRRALVHDALNRRRQRSGNQKKDLAAFGAHNRWSDAIETWVPSPSSPCEDDLYCFSCCQPYRFSYLLPKALEWAGMVKSLGASLLSAYEKGDNEVLTALRSTQERQLLDLGLEISKNQWRAADWDSQAITKQMAGQLTRLQYYQTLLANGLIDGEVGFVAGTEVSMASRVGGDIVEAVGQGIGSTPDIWFGAAGVYGTPLEFQQIPIGTKLSGTFASAARILNAIGEISTSSAGLLQTQASWQRRSDDWQNQVDMATLEIQQIKRQYLASLRRRDVALRELNNHQRQMEHSAEVQHLLASKFTKYELYLFLQQETMALYRESYKTAMQIAREAEMAFRYERGETDRHFLQGSTWDNLHQGLLAGERLELALHTMDRAYMEKNCRQYELQKHISLRLYFPAAFIQLKTVGYCEIDIPEWMFDIDYPGLYMRQIRSVTLSIPCVAGPYTGIHCKLQLLSSLIRISPLLPGPEACCCNDKKSYRLCDHDPYVRKRYGATEAIATSSGQDDSGLFELNFHDDRYLPFEFSGAVSRWRIELPAENNQFDMATLSDIVMHINFLAREGGAELRHHANRRAQAHLPGGGYRFFDIRYEFPDAWRIFAPPRTHHHHGIRRANANVKGRDKDKNHRRDEKGEEHRSLNLRLTRGMFPFLTGRRAVTVSRIHFFVDVGEKDVCPGAHFRAAFEAADWRHEKEGEETDDNDDDGGGGDVVDEEVENDDNEKERKFECVVSAESPGVYHGVVDVHLGPIAGDDYRELGCFRFPKDIPRACEAYMLCEYKVVDPERYCGEERCEK